MLRRNLFVVVVLLGLIASAAFTSWTQDTSGAGGSTPPIASSSPPDTTDYSRPATSADLLSKAKSGALVSPGFVVVEVPNATGGEPDIAINPLNLNQIVIHTFAGGNFPSAGNFISSDGGLTWTLSAQIPGPTGVVGASGPNDITQDYGLDGNLYGTYLTGSTTVGACNPANFDVYSASNTTPFTGGLFSYFTNAGVAQKTNFNSGISCADQPWLLTNVDPTTPGQTNTYVGYDDDSGNNLRVSAAIGTQPPNFTKDNVSGVTFGGGVNQGHRLAVDPRSGAVYSLYQACTGGCGGSPKNIAYILNRSLDAGTNWTLNGSGTGVAVANGTTVQPQPKFGTVNALLGGIDHAAVDPTTGHVFVVYGDSNGSGGNAIFIVEVGFDGSSPTNAVPGTPHQVSLPGAQAALPSVAVAANGTVGVLYTSFDGFDGSGFPIFSGHFAFSTNAGATFTDQTLLTFLSTTKDNGNARQRFLGDYQQLKVVNDLPLANAGATFYGVFTGNGAALGDSTASNQAIFFKVTLAPQINVNPNPVNIGNVCKGSTGQGQLQVSDTGADNLLINSITRASGSTDITLNAGPTFPVNISPDANFGFTFTCTPTTTGSHSAVFNIATNDPANPVTAVTVNCNTPTPAINVTGTGVFGSAVCADTSPAPEQTLQVNNVGACNLNVTSAIINCLDFTLVNPNEFPAAISPDSGLAVGVNFTPTSTGPKSCNLTINSDDPTTPATIIPLTGTQGTGLMTVTGSGSFGNAACGGKAPPQTLRVNNVGPCNLNVTSAVINCPVTATNPGGLPQFALVNPLEFPANISADSGLDVGINFTPTQAGVQTCTITFTSAAPNPQIVSVPLTGGTPFGSTEIKVTVPPGFTFPPTVIQQNAACSSKVGVPITNVGACPVNFTDVDILTQSSVNPPGFDYMLTGVPQLTSPTLGGAITQTVAPGGQLGAGDLDLVFAPFQVRRQSTGTVTVQFEDDPILHTIATDTVPVCGEAVQRGMRVLVTKGGVAVPVATKIALQTAFSPNQPNGDFFTHQTIQNALLRTVSGPAPCASFQYHAEFGGNTNSKQLKPGVYRLKVWLKVGKKTLTSVVRVNLDQCSFNQNVVVAF